MNNKSKLKTNPGKSVSTIYRKQAKNFAPLGKSLAYTSTGDSYKRTYKPSYYQLAAWDKARLSEPYIKQGLNIISLFLLNLIGSYSHSDSEIDAFIKANTEINLKKWFYDLFTSVFWSGYGCAEIIKERKISTEGIPQIWLKDIVNYHPLSVEIILNNYGVIEHGQKVAHLPYKSGIYVPYPEIFSEEFLNKNNTELMGSKIRLPQEKVVYLTLYTEGNNPYGKSMLEAAYPYYLYKEAFKEIYFTALDRYGTPLTYFVVPYQVTEEATDEEGNKIIKTYGDEVQEKIQNLRSSEALVFEKRDPSNSIEVKTLTTGNNFSDSFERAIAMCDRNMLISLGIPNLLLEDRDSSKLGSAKASESQTEIFISLVSAIYDVLVPSFVSQVLHPLILENFDLKLHPLASEPGVFTKKPIRSTDLKITTEAISDLTDKGYLSSNNPKDKQFVRELLGLN